MANLIVRDIDESLLQALKQRAAKHGRSAEVEHREILARVLRRPCKRRLAEVLAAVPNVGRKTLSVSRTGSKRGTRPGSMTDVGKA